MLQAHFSGGFKPLMKREYPRNVWFTFKIIVRKLELLFIVHPYYCAAQFLPLFVFLSCVTLQSSPHYIFVSGCDRFVSGFS